MYKIYHNEKLICLMHQAWDVYIKEKKGATLVVPYQGKTSLLLSVLDKLDKNPDLTSVYILSDDVKKLKKDFFSLFVIIPAAGGLLINRSGHTLLIFRKGYWDLPKGKIDPNETKRQAAVREVMEETGVENAHIIAKLKTTYHIYGGSSKRRILKPVYWYAMYTTSEKSYPQESEGIEKVVWVKGLDRNMYGFRPIYKNISQVINGYFTIIKTIS